MVDVISFGEPLIEFCATRPGSFDEVETFRRGWGGDTCNFIVSVARLGGRGGYICKLGSDVFGKSFLDLLRREGVDITNVLIEKDGFTGVNFILLREGGEHEFIYFRKGSAASHFTPSDLKIDYLKSAKVFHTSGISMGISETCRQTVFKAIEVIKDSGRLFTFDINFRPRLWSPEIARPFIERAVNAADIVFASLEDLTLLYGDTNYRTIVEKLSAEEGIFVIKLGSEGCAIYANKTWIKVPGFKVKVVDTTGAGDAFDGAFVTGFLEGMDLVKLGRFANAVGALTTTGFGAIPPIPRRDSVEEFLREGSIK